MTLPATPLYGLPAKVATITILPNECLMIGRTRLSPQDSENFLPYVRRADLSIIRHVGIWVDEHGNLVAFIPVHSKDSAGPTHQLVLKDLRLYHDDEAES